MVHAATKLQLRFQLLQDRHSRPVYKVSQLGQLQESTTNHAMCSAHLCLSLQS